MTMGYGFSLIGLEEVLKHHNPKLIITVDNGMSSYDAIDRARNSKIDVIVVDHHLEGSKRPNANVIINPNLNDTDFPGKHLAAVGVVFYLLSALAREYGNKNLPLKFCDLVALGTVADMVRLDETNRILINHGIKLIQQKKCQPGIRELFEIANRDINSANEEDLGFAIAPRINAAGRLDDMTLGVECLISQDISYLKRTVGKLNAINQKRKKIQLHMSAEAEQLFSSIDIGEISQPLIILKGKDWHEGVIGLIASRIKDRYGKPAFIFSDGDDSISASARSIPGFHLRDFLIEVDRIYPNLMLRFGGHAMAAGLTINPLDYLQIKKVFYEVAQTFIPEKLLHTVYHDGILQEGEINLDLMDWLDQLRPWGKDFEYPNFYQPFQIVDHQWLQEKHLRCSLRMPNGKKMFNAISFNQDHFNIDADSIYNILYSPKKNEFNGKVSSQLLIQRNIIDRVIDNGN